MNDLRLEELPEGYDMAGIPTEIARELLTARREYLEACRESLVPVFAKIRESRSRGFYCAEEFGETNNRLETIEAELFAIERALGNMD